MPASEFSIRTAQPADVDIIAHHRAEMFRDIHVDLMSIVLHASPDGRALYRSLGFVATNEMRYTRPIDPMA